MYKLSYKLCATKITPLSEIHTAVFWIIESETFSGAEVRHGKAVYKEGLKQMANMLLKIKTNGNKPSTFEFVATSIPLRYEMCLLFFTNAFIYPVRFAALLAVPNQYWTAHSTQSVI